MNILFDCDDVLLDWIGGFWEFAEQTLTKRLDRRGPMSWCMAEWLETTPEEAIDLVRHFNGSRFFGELLPTPGAVDTIKNLAVDHELHVITSCSSAPEVVARREDNLRYVFGDVFSSVTCLNLGASKEDVLRKFPKSHWVEDNLKNALAGHDLGHGVFVRRTPMNRQDEVNKTCGGKVTWFSHWHEITG